MKYQCRHIKYQTRLDAPNRFEISALSDFSINGGFGFPPNQTKVNGNNIPRHIKPRGSTLYDFFTLLILPLPGFAAVVGNKYFICFSNRIFTILSILLFTSRTVINNPVFRNAMTG